MHRARVLDGGSIRFIGLLVKGRRASERKRLNRVRLNLGFKKSFGIASKPLKAMSAAEVVFLAFVLVRSR
jgi:hypothetical protein